MGTGDVYRISVGKLEGKLAIGSWDEDEKIILTGPGESRL